MEKIFYIILVILLLILGESAFGQAPTDYIISDNTASISMGSTALYYSRTGHTGTANIGLGQGSLKSNTLGMNNTSVGYHSMYNNIGGSGNTVMGVGALELGIGMGTISYSNPNQVPVGNSGNTVIGINALHNNNYGGRNVAIGRDAMYEHVGTYLLPFSGVFGDDNVAVGSGTLRNSRSGNGNVAIGTDAMYSYNYHIPAASGYNVSIGYQSMYMAGASGFGITDDIAIGRFSLYKNEGQRNVSIGANALYNNQSGFQNVAIGYQAGFNELGSDKLYIENSSSLTPLIGGDFASDVVGINVPVANLAINPTWKLQVGGDINATGSVRAAGVALTSDIRFKKNIVSLHNTLPNLLKLNSVSYDWKKEDFPDRNFTNKKQFGLIAQEVEKIFPELVDTDANGYKSVNYIQITPILIESIKELTERIQKLESKINN